jgi:hypothetical protein
MQRLACIRVHRPKGADPISPAKFADWTERFALFGRASWSDPASRTIYVESHGRLGLYGGARGWGETLHGFAQGMGLHVSIVVGFRAERAAALARRGVRVLTLASKEDERARVMALPKPAELPLHELGPLWARIA